MQRRLLSRRLVPATAPLLFVLAAASCGDDDTAASPSPVDSGAGSGGQAGTRASGGSSGSGAGGAAGSRAGSGGTSDASVGSGGTGGSSAGSGGTGDASAGSAGTGGSAGTDGSDAGADTDSGGAGGDGGITVDTQGATISDPTGTITVRIPPGALLGNTNFAFAPIGALGSLPAAYSLVGGTAFRIEWSGAGFAPGGKVALSIEQGAPVVARTSGVLELPGDLITIQCESGSIVVFPETTSPDGYTYEQNAIDLDCELGGGAGRHTASAGLVRAVPRPFPAITRHPESVATLDNAPRFSVTATGSLPLAYQWLRNGTEIPGATAASYELTGFQPGDHGARFSVRVSNGLGSVVSNEATLAVCTMAAPDVVGAVPLPGANTIRDLAPGPDGHVWFAKPAAVGFVDTSDPDAGPAVTEFPLTSTPHALAAGPDGNVWFTAEAAGNQLIGRITTAGTLTEFPVQVGTRVRGMAAGPDGNLWFSDGTNIGRITTAGVVTVYYVSSAANLAGVTAGPDGNVWFFDLGGWGVGFTTPIGNSTEHLLPIKPEAARLPNAGIALGPDGNLWFALRRSTTNASLTEHIARLTPAGALTEFVACGRPPDVTPGPDGNLWYGARILADGPHGVGRITPSGAITLFPVASSQPQVVSAGPDGNIWYVESAGSLARLRP